MKTQSLDFRFINNDGRRVTYRAIISNKDSPGSPVYALSVITRSPRNPREWADLEYFLREDVKAAFALGKPVTAQQDSSAHHPLSFSPGREVLFVAELVAVNSGSSFEVEFEIDSSISSTGQPVSNAPQEPTSWLYSGSVYSSAKKFQIAGGGQMSAVRVSCSQGAVKVYSRWQWHHLGFAIASENPHKDAWTQPTRRVTIRNNVSGQSNFKIYANAILHN
jgi:hypothetical protein